MDWSVISNIGDAAWSWQGVTVMAIVAVVVITTLLIRLFFKFLGKAFVIQITRIVNSIVEISEKQNTQNENQRIQNELIGEKLINFSTEVSSTIREFTRKIEAEFIDIKQQFNIVWKKFDKQDSFNEEIARHNKVIEDTVIKNLQETQIFIQSNTALREELAAAMVLSSDDRGFMIEVLEHSKVYVDSVPELLLQMAALQRDVNEIKGNLEEE